MLIATVTAMEASIEVLLIGEILQYLDFDHDTWRSRREGKHITRDAMRAPSHFSLITP